MGPELRKQIQNDEHFAAWAPPFHCKEDWIVDHSKSTGRMDVTPGRVKG